MKARDFVRAMLDYIHAQAEDRFDLSTQLEAANAKNRQDHSPEILSAIAQKNLEIDELRTSARLREKLIADFRAELAELRGTELMVCAYCGTCEPSRKDQRLPCPRGCVDPTPDKTPATLQPVDAVIRNRVDLIAHYHAACMALGLLDVAVPATSPRADEWNRFLTAITAFSPSPDLGRQDPESESPALVEAPDGR